MYPNAICKTFWSRQPDHICINVHIHISILLVAFSNYLKGNYKGILVYEILMDCVARKRIQKTTSNYLKWFPRYCDLNFYKLSH